MPTSNQNREGQFVDHPAKTAGLIRDAPTSFGQPALSDYIIKLSAVRSFPACYHMSIHSFIHSFIHSVLKRQGLSHYKQNQPWSKYETVMKVWLENLKSKNQLFSEVGEILNSQTFERENMSRFFDEGGEVDVLLTVVESNYVHLLKCCAEVQFWGTCTLLDILYFVLLYTYTPLHCTFYSTTFIW